MSRAKQHPMLNRLIRQYNRRYRAQKPAPVIPIVGDHPLSADVVLSRLRSLGINGAKTETGEVEIVVPCRGTEQSLRELTFLPTIVPVLLETNWFPSCIRYGHATLSPAPADSKPNAKWRQAQLKRWQPGFVEAMSRQVSRVQPKAPDWTNMDLLQAIGALAIEVRTGKLPEGAGAYPEVLLRKWLAGITGRPEAGFDLDAMAYYLDFYVDFAESDQGHDKTGQWCLWGLSCVGHKLDPDSPDCQTECRELALRLADSIPSLYRQSKAGAL